MAVLHSSLLGEEGFDGEVAGPGVAGEPADDVDRLLLDGAQHAHGS